MYTKFTWTVSIIVQYDETVQNEYLELEASIIKQKSNKNIRYFIFVYDQNTREATIKVLTYKDKRKFRTIEMGSIAFYSGKPLEDFFSTYVARKKTRRLELHRHLLLLWGHGCGMGLFSHEPPKENLPKGLKEFVDTIEEFTEKLRFIKTHYSINDSKFDYHSFLKPVYMDYSKQYQVEELDMNKWISYTKSKIELIAPEKLKTIIQNGLKEQISIILTMNCYMQTFETGFALKDVSEMLIGPQTGIPFYGYNYKRLFKLLHASPETSIKEIAQNIIYNYPLKYLEAPIKAEIDAEGKYKDFPVFNVSICATFLNKYADILTLINDDWAQHFLIHYQEHTSFENQVRAARRLCHYFGTKNMGIIDFKHFIDELIKQLEEEEYKDFKEKYLRLFELQKATLAAIYSSPTLFSPDPVFRDEFPSESPQFFSIFFPSNRGDEFYLIFFIEQFYLEAAPNQPILNKSFLWNDFILKYCKMNRIYP